MCNARHSSGWLGIDNAQERKRRICLNVRLTTSCDLHLALSLSLELYYLASVLVPRICVQLKSLAIRSFEQKLLPIHAWHRLPFKSSLPAHLATLSLLVSVDGSRQNITGECEIICFVKSRCTTPCLDEWHVFTRVVDPFLHLTSGNQEFCGP